MAILRGMAKFLLLWERQALAEGKEAVFDHDFLNEHTANVLEYLGQDRRHLVGGDRRAVRLNPGGRSEGGTHVRQRQECNHVLGMYIVARHAGLSRKRPGAAARRHRPFQCRLYRLQPQ